MKTKIFLTAIASLAALTPVLTSCEDMLEEKAYTFVTTNDITNDNNGADAWTIGVYNSNG